MVFQTENGFLKSSIYIASLAIVIMVFFIILFIVYYQRKQAEQRILLQDLEADMQKKLLENSLEVQESERHRIAKDLHDDIGALLAATKMSLNQVVKKADGETSILLQAQNTKEMLDESISHVRRISKELVPSTLEGFGLVIALEEYIHKLTPLTETEFDFQYENIERKERFDKKIELGIYRIAQELVNNAFKHAEANKISLLVSKTNNHLIFTFADDGKGFDYKQTLLEQKSGLGLLNIQSRLNVVSGKVAISSAIGNGTKTRIEIPLKTILNPS